MNELNEQILDAWIQLTTAINNERIVSEMPLNEALICRMLYHNKDKNITATDLCGWTNRTLISMEQKGWIHRQRSEKDKRQIFIVLNEDKMILYREQHEHILSIVNKLVDRIGEENANQALKLFNLIAQIAGEEIV